jgi:hypothetical protein
MMITRILTGILVAAFCAAVGRGIVFAFGLDAKVARMIQVASTSANTAAIAWIISGAFGIIGLISWEMFNVVDRLNAMFPVNRPALGSLSYEQFIANVNRNPTTGQTNVQMIVEVQNRNDFLVKYRAKLNGEVNGKTPDRPVLEFEGFAPAHQNRYVMYDTIFDVPIDAIPPGAPFLSGRLYYDLIYFAAPAGRATRRTARSVSFATQEGSELKPIGTRIEIHIITRFTDEQEE